MWGASSFEEHPVAKMVMQAAILLEEHGWSQLTIPFCDREFLDNALRGSMFFAETTKCSSLSRLYFHDFIGASAVSVPPPHGVDPKDNSALHAAMMSLRDWGGKNSCGQRGGRVMAREPNGVYSDVVKLRHRP